MATGPESNPATLVGGERSDHCAIPSPNSSKFLALKDASEDVYLEFRKVLRLVYSVPAFPT